MDRRFILCSIAAVVLPASAGWAAETGGYRLPVSVAVVNASTAVSDAEAAAWTAVIQRQVREHLAPFWKVDADIRFDSTGASGDWVCRIEDEAASSPTLLGTHFLAENGSAACAVYARTILKAPGRAVSTILSHEILEMLVDPWLSNVTFASLVARDGVAVYLREICDPVSAYSYQLDGVEVSDFTLPEFWRAAGPAAGRVLNYLGSVGSVHAVNVALRPAEHSYMLVRYITPFGGVDPPEGWQYLWGTYCIFGPC